MVPVHTPRREGSDVAGRPVVADGSPGALTARGTSVCPVLSVGDCHIGAGHRCGVDHVTAGTTIYGRRSLYRQPMTSNRYPRELFGGIEKIVAAILLVGC
ncbi:hypothetical protein GCM10027169_31650 [Gordonia jinhuaensis]|uniref:Uncharacterized protein n=1 Tax=Gordonia jinhuaensis TaxID=1517702 RepID=A0A916T6S8_9ACTN|nr:hypothetical protein GCM10011489_22450 [Gordonia jinhuaensis]